MRVGRADAHGGCDRRIAHPRLALPNRRREGSVMGMRAWIDFTALSACLSLACGGCGKTSAGAMNDGGGDGSEGVQPIGSDGMAADDVTGAGESDSAGGTDRSVTDGASASDTGTFACGSIVCTQAEVCVHQRGGCTLAMPRDAGACSPGNETSDGGLCSDSDPGSYCWSPDAGTTLVCDRADGGLFGIFDSLPDGTDRVCYSSCT